MEPIQKFLDLKVYQIARKLASEVFNLTKKFPPEEKYSLTDQIRRSSRSVKANIAEGWGKRKYPEVFKRHLVDSLGSLEETKSWLISSLDCNYISGEYFENLYDKYDTLGGKIFRLHERWKGNVSVVGGQKTEAGGLKSEVGGLKTEVGGRKIEVRSQRSEVGLLTSVKL